MRNILVTGVAGFIGSSLAERLLALGNKVVGLDNFDPFYPRRFKEKNLEVCRFHPGFEFVEGDLCDEAVWRRCEGKRVSAIIHLAARAGVRPSIEDPIAYYRTNITGTGNMLEFAKRQEIGKVLFASSSSVYGNLNEDSFREDCQDLLPISPYAATKLSGESLGHVYSHLYDMTFIGLRFFTVFGPRQRPDLAIHRFVKMIDQGESIPVFGDGRSSRDYTYIDDTIDGIVSALDCTRCSKFEIINLGNDRSIHLSEMIKTIERVMDRKARIMPMPEQPGDVKITKANIDKARTLLGYNPRMSFADGVRKFVRWYRNDLLGEAPSHEERSFSDPIPEDIRQPKAV